MQAKSQAGVLTAIKRCSLKQAVVEQIRMAISRRELEPGERVTELGLGATLGVGQATIREALIELQHQGYVQRRGRGDTRITSLTAREIEDIYAVRICIEALTLDLLAGACGPDLSGAEGALVRMRDAAVAGAAVAFFEADLDFHRALWAATGNQAVADTLEQIVPPLFAFGVIRNARPSNRTLLRNAAEHRTLLGLISSGDVAGAQSLMKDSMEAARREDAELGRQNPGSEQNGFNEHAPQE